MTTKAPSKCLAYLGPEGVHDFHPVSGWCLNGCGLREDGRHLTTAGSVIDPGPEYTPEDLATLPTNYPERSTTYHEQPTLNIPTA